MAKGRLKGFFALLCCLITIIIFLSGCGYNLTYRGKYPDLYTVAINSILWNAGHSMGADFAQQPTIKILERDEYGRTLFFYYEKHTAESNLIISQYSEDDFVYYYEDYNFLTKNDDYKKANFSQEEKDYLKSLNDWNKEIDLDKCVKKQIIRKKPSIPCDKKIIEEKVVQKFELEGKNFRINPRYLTSDSLGNFIVYVYLYLGAENRTNIDFVVFINADCEVIDFLVPADHYNYNEELKEFKAENGWVS